MRPSVAMGGAARRNILDFPRLAIWKGACLLRSMRRDLKDYAENDRVELSIGPIYSFLPAHGGSRAGAVAEQLSRTLSEVPGLPVLLAGLGVRGCYLLDRPHLPRRLDGEHRGGL